MTVESVRAAAARFLEELPQQVHDALEAVTVQVLDGPPPGCPADVKAIFTGQQQQGDPDDDEDCDAGAWYDINDQGELELVAVGGCVPARGVIALVAPNLFSEDEVHIALAHETGHALGMDEDDVAELGLA